MLIAESSSHKCASRYNSHVHSPVRPETLTKLPKEPHQFPQEDTLKLPMLLTKEALTTCHQTEFSKAKVLKESKIFSHHSNLSQRTHRSNRKSFIASISYNGRELTDQRIGARYGFAIASIKAIHLDF